MRRLRLRRPCRFRHTLRLRFRLRLRRRLSIDLSNRVVSGCLGEFTV